MSEPIPEAIPTSSHPRPAKRRALSPRATHASHVASLLANPTTTIHLPPTSTSAASSAPPEIVANVQGSSAGAGSGEFHVYKASRRREYERLRAMDDEVRGEAAEKAFLERRGEVERADREKTERNRAKRAKALARKAKAKKGGVVKVDEAGKRKLVANANAVKTGDGAEEGEGEGAEAVGGVGNVEEIGLVIEDDD
ncbi:hypothetical protein C7974DRAFT_434953 [Boeremia exigua]|uniref:uncharacterized protein n=1 Tax=Boeremia exigua TaxID=749465 RepID=UPI001E8D9824|nr:uncharacterized protein C7974DRAFT_434953 [Boeremia exigua]KAH6621795.1 hypothetical protein C7974DRAFT_434953 [Boeremia exigua]